MPLEDLLLVLVVELKAITPKAAAPRAPRERCSYYFYSSSLCSPSSIRVMMYPVLSTSRLVLLSYWNTEVGVDLWTGGGPYPALGNLTVISTV